MAGRVLKLSLKLSEFDIRYDRRKSLKAQVSADSVTKMTTSDPQSLTTNVLRIFMEGASSPSGGRVGIILENRENLIIEVSLILSFPTTNNQAEYEVFLAELRMAKDLRAQEVKIYIDSQLVSSQVNRDYQEKNDILI